MIGPGPGPECPRRRGPGPHSGPWARGPGPHTGPWAPAPWALGLEPGPNHLSIHPSIYTFMSRWGMYEIIESTFLYGGGEIRNTGFLFLIWELAYKKAPVYHQEPVREVHPQHRPQSLKQHHRKRPSSVSFKRPSPVFPTLRKGCSMVALSLQKHPRRADTL